MMGHGKHDKCMMCQMGKAIGMIEKCTDKNCAHPSHKKEKEKEGKKVNNKKIKFYGAAWCPDCRRAKEFLDGKGVEYEYIDLEKDPNAAAEVERINNGLQSIPTIIFPNGSVLAEPSNEQLQEALDANRDL